jgi:phosphate transport system substrate-binding protein
MSHAQRIWRWVLAACIVVGLISNASADDQKLVLTGSSTIAPLALEIGKRFEKQNPGVRVDVQSGGSTRGVTDARAYPY